MTLSNCYRFRYFEGIFFLVKCGVEPANELAGLLHLLGESPEGHIANTLHLELLIVGIHRLGQSVGELIFLSYVLHDDVDHLLLRLAVGGDDELVVAGVVARGPAG